MTYIKLVILLCTLLFTKPTTTLNIGLFTDQYKPWIGGIETAVETIKDALRNAGHTAFVITHQHPDYPDGTDNVIRLSAWENPFNENFDLILPNNNLIKKLKKLNLDVIHAHTHSAIGAMALYFARSENIPLVYTNHMYLPREWELEFNINPFIAKTFNTLLCNQCDHIIAPSTWIQQSLKEWGVTTPIKVVPTGILIDNFYHKKDVTLLEHYHIKSDDLILITVGRLCKEKNIGFLLKVLAATKRATNRSLKLIIIGDGPEKQNLKKLTQKLNLTDSVVFTGFIKHQAIAQYFALADVYVHAAWFETQGIIFAEAMASYLPIVTTNSGGARDAVKEGQTGFMVTEDLELFKEKLLLLINDEALRNTLSIQSRIRSQLFSAQTMGKQLITLYKECIDSNKALKNSSKSIFSES